MTTNLKQRVDAVMALNEKRTTGLWVIDVVSERSPFYIEAKDPETLRVIRRVTYDGTPYDNPELPRVEDMMFINASPSMISIITDLIALNKQLAEALHFYATADSVMVSQHHYPESRTTETWDDEGHVAKSALQSYHQHGFGE